MRFRSSGSAGLSGRCTTKRKACSSRRWGRADLKVGRISVAAHGKVAKGEVRLVPTRVDSHQWKITVSTKVRGKGLARPLIAVALLALRGKIDRQITEGLRKAERRWHDAVPPLLRRDPSELVEDLVLKLRANSA